jgi:heme/copper-type cytochrome/quinol oxidase subunit 2
VDTHRIDNVTRERSRDGNLYRTAFWIGCCAAMLTGMLLALVLSSGTLAAQGPQPTDENRREVSVLARRNGFSPARVEVHQNDLVKVTFTAEDAPHSFNIDEYRIAKRARPGHPAVFEFRADRAGTFSYYCNLSSTTGTHDMKGELVVVER